MDSPKVRLNVGGRIHVTQKATLLKYPETLLARGLTRPELFKTEEDGSYFFDRNPDLFSYVLDFYRTGELVYPTMISQEAFNKELQFWGIKVEFDDFPKLEDIVNFNLLILELVYRYSSEWCVTCYWLAREIENSIKKKKRTGVVPIAVFEKDDEKRLKEIFNLTKIEKCYLKAKSVGDKWLAYDKKEKTEVETIHESKILKEGEKIWMRCLRFEF